MSNIESKITSIIDCNRIKTLAFECVSIPSPTGHEKKFAEF